MSVDAELEYLEPSGTPGEANPPRDRPGWIRLFAALATALCFDFGVYRGNGYAGFALFFGGGLLAYLIGGLRRHHHTLTWVLSLMLMVVVVRLMWLGSPPLILWGLILLPAVAMCAQGMVPYFVDWIAFTVQASILGGQSLLVQYLEEREAPTPRNPRIGGEQLLAYGLPLAVVSLFLVIFVQANPDVAASLAGWLGDVGDWLLWVSQRINVDVLDIFFVVTVTWISLGHMSRFIGGLPSVLIRHVIRPREYYPGESPFYRPFCNTLMAVNVLFALYLMFEFSTLWFREFPKGFYYAGYAHRGAAWLTFALALATLMLSGIFRGQILADPRVAFLKRLAAGWSVANFLLAVSVYNRLWIYIDFNGMTRMRVLGIYGISTVVVGFLLVVWKIHRNQRFDWLIQRQLWTLACGLYLLTVTPVDWLIHSYNTRQILAGDLAPTVQFTEHEVNVSGWTAVLPLIDCQDPIIRDGVRAKLADVYFHPEQTRWLFTKHDGTWSEVQWAELRLFQELESRKELWEPYRENALRNQTWERLRTYAYQWY